MIRRAIYIFLAMFLTFSMSLPAYAAEMKIAAVVNESIISMVDVQERMKFVLMSSGLPNTKDMRAKILPQVINGLIEEQLKVQEAERHDLTVSSEDIDAGLKVIAAQNKMTLPQFKKLMAAQHMPIGSFRHQIKAQVAWTKVVTNILRPQVNVSENDIEARLAQLKRNVGKTEYNVSEIYIPVDNKTKESDVKKLTDHLVKEIRKNHAPFNAVAAQFSKSDNAKNAGALGWILKDHLPEKMSAALLTLKDGEISNPIREFSGFHILKLNKTRTMSDGDIPPRDEITNQIGLARLDRLQQRHLADLKSAAYIDVRL